MRLLLVIFVVCATTAYSGSERVVQFTGDGTLNYLKLSSKKPYAAIRGSRHGECTGYLFDPKKGEEFVVPQPRRCSDVDLCNLILEKPKAFTYKNNWSKRNQYLGRGHGTALNMAPWIKEANRRGFTPDSCLDTLVTVFKAAGGKMPSNKITEKQSRIPATQASLLEQSFRKLSVDDRKEIQSTLKKLGHYKSSIDGVYGKGTAAALKEYNKQHFLNADLEKQEFVTDLLQDTLAYEEPDTDEVSITSAGNSVVGTPIVSEEVTELVTGEDASPVEESFYDAYVAGDYKLAFSRASEVAIKGDPYAQLYLGIMFEEGKGTLPLNTNAYMWYSIADLNGEVNAGLKRMLLTDRMTNASVEEAQNMARACIESGFKDCSFVKSNSSIQAHKRIQDTIFYITDGDQLKTTFVKSSLLKRKQLQYALKAMRLYDGSIDGIWGKNTSRGFDQFLGFNLVETTDAAKVFDKLLSLVKVPSSFATQKPKNVTRKAKNEENEDCVSILSMLGIPICNKNPKWDYEPSRSNSDSGSSMIFSNVSNECSTDFDCGFGSKCVRRAGLKSICVKPSDKFGNSVGGIRSTLASCRTRADCPALYSCDRNRGICVRD